MNLLVGEIVRTLSDLCLAFKVNGRRADRKQAAPSASTPQFYCYVSIEAKKRRARTDPWQLNVPPNSKYCESRCRIMTSGNASRLQPEPVRWGMYTTDHSFAKLRHARSRC